MGDKATVQPWAEFPDSDYYFGEGTLRIEVKTLFGRPENHHGNWCLLVEGVEYCWNGDPIGTRRVYIRVAALKAAGVPGL